MKMTFKRSLTMLLAFLLIMSMTSIAAFAVDSENEAEQMGVLYYGPDNIRIYAKVSDLMVFVNAAGDAAKDQALHALISDTENIITEMDEMPFELVSGASEETEAEAVALRSPGTWKINAFTIAGSSVTAIKPTDKTAFDVAYNETVQMTYYCSPDRLISVMCETSRPSTFYDPDYGSGTTTFWHPGVSGQYKIYFKNYSTSSASITGGSVKIYS